MPIDYLKYLKLIDFLVSQGMRPHKAVAEVSSAYGLDAFSLETIYNHFKRV